MSNIFKGEFKVTTQSLLGKADIKRLRTSLMDEFPALTKKMLDKVLRSKEDVEVHVLKCSNGTQLYVPGDGPPAFFDDGFGGVYPTLFTLWKLPAVMPELVTHGPVSKFLLPKERSAGADMMLPGVIVPEEGLGSFAEGQKRCIRVQGNDAPFAVGKMCVPCSGPLGSTVSSSVDSSLGFVPHLCRRVSDRDITKEGMKGKGMAVLHVYRDSLWTYGGRKVCWTWKVSFPDHPRLTTALTTLFRYPTTASSQTRLLRQRRPALRLCVRRAVPYPSRLLAKVLHTKQMACA